MRRKKHLTLLTNDPIVLPASEPDAQEMVEQDERMASVVNHVVDGIISIDERGTVTTFNPAAERIFGYSAAEVIGRASHRRATARP